MLFTEFRFLVFFALAFGVHWALRRSGARKTWLLVCSYVFYGAWRWEFLGLIVFSTALDYVVGRGLSRGGSPHRRRLWLLGSLVGNLGVLGLFKYYDFFVESGARFLAFLGLEVHPAALGLVLPVGISFYTFQTLSYTIDVYYGRLEPVRDLRDFALFVAFFPQLVAGPIVRAADFLPQLQEPRSLRAIDWRRAASLFLFGYVKKACVADNIAAVIDPVFTSPHGYAPAALWLALLLYAVQIYCDFSGYSDMAIATAAALGYHLPENFRFPYLAPTVTDFWRRWHISLSTWFRDYLYVPLGGNRRSPLRTYLNLVTVFFLCGLWHGASWNFVVWGLIHGFFLVLERILGRRTESRLLGVDTFLITILAWVFFRASTLGIALDYLAGLFGLRAGAGQIDPRWWILFAGFAVVHVAMARGLVERSLGSLRPVAYAAAYGAAWALVFPFASTSYEPFIYFQF